MRIKKKKLLKEGLSTFAYLILARYIIKKYRGIPKENLLHYTTEGIKDLFIGFVKYLNNYGYSVDVDMLEYKFDGILQMALEEIKGQEFKKGGFDRSSWSNYFADDFDADNKPLKLESKKKKMGKKIYITESQLDFVINNVDLLNEQETSVASLGYVIQAGASNVPMRTAVLNKNQKFPLPEGTTEKDNHLFEITLQVALNGHFDKAILIEKVEDSNRDQIVFGSESIVNSGKITIPINNTTLSQKIRVSGNGALVLSRVANEYQEIKKNNGVMILELSAPSLYSNSISLEKLGINDKLLSAKLRPAIQDILTRMHGENGKKQLDPNVSRNAGYMDKQFLTFKNIFVGDSSNIVNTFQPYFGKYEQSTMTKDIAKISKLLVTNLVSPSLDIVNDGVKKYLNDKFANLPEDIKKKIGNGINVSTERSKKLFHVGTITTMIKNSYGTSELGKRKPAPKSKINQNTQNYKQGKS